MAWRSRAAEHSAIKRCASRTISQIWRRALGRCSAGAPQTQQFSERQTVAPGGLWQGAPCTVAAWRAPRARLL
eukprot:8856318-Lingulodinium_polyedra.AAC.1